MTRETETGTAFATDYEVKVEPDGLGYRVVDPSRPNSPYLIEEVVNRFLCGCNDFEESLTCQHVRAVLSYLAEEKRNGGNIGPQLKVASTNAEPSSATMALRRSISPDGRIDSLTIEFSTPVDNTSFRDITARALNILKLQSVVTKEFLLTAHAGRQSDRSNGHNQVVTLNAKMIRIGDVPTKRDRPLFIEFHLEDHGARLFGTASELAQAITDAGYPYAPEEIFAGQTIDASCQVLIKSSRNPLYAEILRVLPKDFSFSDGGSIANG
ncbi:MAG TPA: hypothetical protein VI306_26200 [Pyrinomonadaceae bacterium]